MTIPNDWRPLFWEVSFWYYILPTKALRRKAWRWVHREQLKEYVPDHIRDYLKELLLDVKPWWHKLPWHKKLWYRLLHEE